MNKKIISLPELRKQLVVTAYSQIRPYRQGGYRIQHETLKNKNIFHNYGHGGSGVSWSYGSAVRIVNLFEKNTKVNENKCAVIGSGVIGLVTALQLVNRKYKVQVYSKRIPKFAQKNNKYLITSQIAPGFWFPYDYLDLTHLNTDELASTTMKFLRKSIDQKKYSALKYCKTYDQVFSTKIIQHFQNVLVEKNKKTLIDFGSGKHLEFNQFSTVRIDMQLWFKQIIQQLKIKGVQFVDKQFKNVNEVLQLQQKNIFNCTGFGSKYLFNDNKMKPMRGHIVEFKNNNPEVFNYIFGTKINDEVIRIYGHQSRILLGLTKEQTEICQVDQQIVNKLINNYQKLYNSWSKPNSKL